MFVVVLALIDAFFFAGLSFWFVLFVLIANLILVYFLRVGFQSYAVILFGLFALMLFTYDFNAQNNLALYIYVYLIIDIFAYFIDYIRTHVHS